MDWILLNADQLLTAITGIIAAASVIANFTKTDTDNKIVAALGKAVNYLALNFKTGKK